ncbi:tyrosinase family protein [Kitasatospora sp. NPDC001603]|uniref:tyrosinase family protein n=1 Tax=Kitasatospora sp. NPDC001603 TaxID=3154388 RepID=UPI003316CAF6
MSNGTFIRRDASKMAEWDPVLYWYARAVGRMQQRSATDPTSWVFQGCIHGIPPTVTQTHEAFSQCPHGGWFFLPWHRGYLWYFERIIRAAIKEIAAEEHITPDPSTTWALPYWDYALDPPTAGPPPTFTTRALPAAFRSPKMPDRPGGTTLTVDNPLCLRDDLEPTTEAEFWAAPHRAKDKNAAHQVLPYVDLNPFRAMSATIFAATKRLSAVQPTFGSEVSYTVMPHFQSGFGELENVPHNQVHGGVGGWMGRVEGSARDPIFWLHHANLDRLWSGWLDKGNQNPDHTSWLDHEFIFFDGNGQEERPTSKVVMDDARDYAYESLTDGSGTRPVILPPVQAPRAGERVLAASVANPRQPLDVRAATTVSLEPSGVEGAMRSLAARDEPQTNLILTVHDVYTEIPPGTPFHVFLNGPGGDLDPEGPYFVGWISFFGMAGAGGHDASYDVTEQVQRLKDQGLMPDGPLTVSIVPSIPQPATNIPQPSFESVSLTSI